MKQYYLNGEKVARPRKIVVDGKFYIYSPSDEQIISAGYEIKEVIVPTPEPYIPTIEELTEQKLRERYSINQEFEVQRKRDTDPQGFAAYYDYVEECIAWAKSQPHREGSGDATA